MIKYILKSVIVSLLILSFSACSTVMNTTTQEVEIKSTPANAKIVIDGRKFGTTPQTVNIERGKDHIIKLSLDGYDLYETQMTGKISAWFWFNVFNGIIPGMLVDMITGSMYSLYPETINIELQQAKPAVPNKKQ